MPTGMYEGAGHGPLWWIAYLAVAITLVTVMILVMLRGIGRAGEAVRPAARATDEATEPAPPVTVGVPQPVEVTRHEGHPTLHGAA